MGPLIFWIVQGIICSLYFVTLYMAYKTRKTTSYPSNFKDFLWYPLIGSILTVFYWLKYLNIYALPYFVLINKTSLLFHFGFLSRYIYIEVNKKAAFRYTAICFFIIQIPFVYFDIINHTILSFSVTNGCLFILCCYYFYYLFLAPPILNLFKEPSFWVCCGILLGSGLLIPFYSFSRDISKIITNLNAHYLLGTLSTLGYGIMYIFFIKAYLCILLQRK